MHKEQENRQANAKYFSNFRSVLQFSISGYARVGALVPPQPHGHDDGDPDDEPHQVQHDDELDEVDGVVGHGPESELHEEEDDRDEEAEERQCVGGDPADAEAALVSLDVALGDLVRVGEGDVEGEAIEGEVEAAQGEDEVDVGPVEAADDEARQAEQDDQGQQREQAAARHHLVQISGRDLAPFRLADANECSRRPSRSQKAEASESDKRDATAESAVFLLPNRPRPSKADAEDARLGRTDSGSPGNTDSLVLVLLHLDLLMHSNVRTDQCRF